MSRDPGTPGWRLRGLWPSGLFAFLVWLVAGAAWGQGPTDAALRGRVVDARGAALAGGRVELRPGFESGAEVTAVGMFAQTDRRGGFTLLGLVPGEYRAEVVMPGGMGQVGPVRVVLGAGGVDELELRVGDGFPWVTLRAVPLGVEGRTKV